MRRIGRGDGWGSQVKRNEEERRAGLRSCGGQLEDGRFGEYMAWEAWAGAGDRGRKQSGGLEMRGAKEED